MNNSILQLFEGLTFDQAKELRRRIVPALVEIRADILSNDTAAKTSKVKTTRGKNDEMYSYNNEQRAM